MATELHLRDTGVTACGRAVFELSRPYVCRVQLPGLRIRVIVPMGFRTDFASIPRPFWRLYNPTGPWRTAAVVHDYLYSKRARCPRFLADAVFRHLMQEARCHCWARLPIYYAVRCFGWTAYRVR